MSDIAAEPEIGLAFRETGAPVADGAFRVARRGRVERTRRVGFTFDGKPYGALGGDTVASALLANGVHLMGRSFKYHRPRGILSAGSEDANALIGTSRGPGRFEPNTRATMQEVFDGLAAESQNRWPSLGFDIGAINDAIPHLFAAGFYYKTFKWPRPFWHHVYEPVIRAAAGLGRAPHEADPDSYTARYHHTDILVVGAGPAGLAAALAAGRSGARVLLVDEHSEMGGSLLSMPEIGIDARGAWSFLAETLAELASLPNVRLLPRTTAFGYFHQNMVALAERLTDHLASPPDGAPRERLWRVRAREVVLAQGAIEKPLVFDGNDRPAVMLASAARTMLNRYGVLVGEHPAVVTSHDSAYATAFELADAGATIPVIIDARPTVEPVLLDEAARRGIAVATGHTVLGTEGRMRVSGLKIAPVTGGTIGAARAIHCDAVLMSGGWTPSLHLFSHTKASLVWDEDLKTFLPGQSPEACVTAGGGAGHWGIAAALEDGARAGATAAAKVGHLGRVHDFSVEGERVETGATIAALPSRGTRGKAFVDHQNDVTAKDVRLAVREGMRSIEHVKRYTTTGMATDQGKTSNINALLIAAEALGKSPPEVGLTTFRPPYTPTTFGTFANHHAGATFEVTRKTPINGWAEAQGAVFEPVALWRRARYFPRGNETMREAVARECRATREAVGLFDASTLGKIEVVGPDAAEFLNRLYTNPFLKLAPGRCRYGVLLGEDGFIRDDGVIARIAEDRFHVTTTTGGAPRVLTMMEDYLQTEWPDLKVWLTSTTEEWATVALNGPLARAVLAPLVKGLDIAADAFPHMSVAECKVAGVPVRLCRMSFTGELGFEVNVPARHALAVWEAIWTAGQPHGITPYGTETMHVLRAEKGFIIVGQETDGTVTPDDAGLAWAIGKTKRDFVGMRSLARPDLVATGRKQLVGLLTRDPATVLEEGAQLVEEDARPPVPMIGHVTSSYWSETLGRSIALALVKDGRARIGETLYLPMPDTTIAAEVVAPVFYDPDGARFHL
ncbi:sarcosine oxidase subunit alpha family protein [Acuticoccus sp. M5D2P5]|uniref:sarcosine oxidase subunit alpha family protein n=1 Tax=Acuticoccus kalidii TaxID=2910977 RepID=UPI001F3391FB|nr:sarcosine oxidase subunit alpha family protein [Acuticoccus kalidii]MCF3932339.1 sarcosine oxidase subunit alpha family protein [Acuticoccus kalidii]